MSLQAESIGRSNRPAFAKWWVALLSIAALCQFGVGPAWAQVVTEFSVGITQAPAPRAIVLGPDGNIWFTEFGGNRVGKITPAGVVTEYSAGITPGAGPGGIALGPDGNLWFTERLINKIARITPSGTVTEFGGLTAGALPVFIVAGPDGALWFTENSGNRIGRITTTGTVTEYSAGLTAGAAPVSIVVGPDNNLWFTEGNNNKIGVITTAGVITEIGSGMSVGANASGIALGPDNNIWFTEVNTDKIAYITLAGVVTEFGGLTAGAGPNSVEQGPDGNMWFAELNGNRIGKITLAGAVTEYSAGISAGAMPRNIVTGSDGNLWFTEFGLPQIGMSTPLGVITEFSAGITPGAGLGGIVADAGGNLWFTEQGIDAIGKMVAPGVATQFTTGITPGASPRRIALGPDGNFWFTEYGIDRIGMITPGGVVTEFSANITPGAAPYGIAAGPDGNLWFAESGVDKIGQITTSGVVTEFGIGITAGASPWSITAGPDGALWFTERLGNRIGRITTAGAINEYSAGITGSFPSDITTGPDLNLWFTERNGSKIGRITPAGSISEFATGVSGAPGGIAKGPDNNLWFTEITGNRIGRITPAGVVTTFATGISAGATPWEITANVDGNMFFTEIDGNRVGRLLMPGTNYVVTNNTDNGGAGSGSLRDAINRANADPGPNTITFDPSLTGATITLTSGAISITDAVTITGPGSASLTIDGNALNRIFVLFELNSPACPALSGPVDYLVSLSGMTLTNAQRHTDNSGGAIVAGHSLALDDVIIQNSIAKSGGGIGWFTQYPGQSLTITNSKFLNNIAKPLPTATSSQTGGGLKIGENCSGTRTTPVPVNISNSVFSGNRVQPTTLSGFGGAIDFSGSYASITITNTRIVDNHVDAPNPPVANQIYQGGGLRGTGKALTIRGSEISGNSLTDVTAADVTRGGGLHLYDSDPGLQDAAGVYNVSIVNSTISGNASPSTSGAMLVFGNTAVSIYNSTIANNASDPTRTGGILMSTGATSPPSAGNATPPTLTLVSTILAKNVDSDLSENLATMPSFTVNATHSAIQNICPLPSCNIIVTGANNLLPGVDPMLAPLANNGGPTQTHALLAGSPALDAGSNLLALPNDQRGSGFPRVLNGTADMGAYEGFVTTTPPVLQSKKSRKTQGAGTFDLLLQ